MSNPVSRRTFLLGIAGTAALAACAGGDEPEGGGTTLPTVGPDPTEAGELVLGEAFDRNNLLVAGREQRAPFLLFEATGGLVAAADAPDELVFTIRPQQGDALADVRVARAGDDIERAYYPLVVTFPETGAWEIATTAGGQDLSTSVAVNEAVDVPQLGDALPSAPTPTTADPLDVTTLCTRDPACPFHELSLADVVAAGRPVAVLVSTPAYCVTAICGPVLDLLIDSAPAIDVIHVEVYPDLAPPDGVPSDLVTTTFGLGYEPVLFVAGADGRISARLDNIYDGAELAAALASAT